MRNWKWAGLAVPVLAVAISMTSCSRCDRGACLKSHIEHRHQDAYSWVQMMPISCGKDCTTYIPITHYEPARDWDETVCDQWQCPSGKWLEDGDGEETICADTAGPELPK
jgi:hypothetical protein